MNCKKITKNKFVSFAKMKIHFLQILFLTLISIIFIFISTENYAFAAPYIKQASSESEFVVPAKFAFTPRWHTSSTMTPFGNYKSGEFTASLSNDKSAWIFDSSNSTNSGVNITNVGNYKGKDINLKITITKFSGSGTFAIAKKFEAGDTTYECLGPDVTIKYDFTYASGGKATSDLNFHTLYYCLTWTSAGDHEAVTVNNTNLQSIIFGNKLVNEGNTFRGNTYTPGEWQRSLLCQYSGSTCTFTLAKTTILEISNSKVSKDKINFIGRVFEDKTKKQIGQSKTVSFNAGIYSASLNVSVPTGYTLVSSKLDELVMANPSTTATVSYPYENHTLDLYVKKNTYKIESSVENGVITQGSGVEFGDSKLIEFEPLEGYHLKTVLVDGKEVDINKFSTEYNFESISANHKIHVVYEIDSFNIKTSVEGGLITESSTVTYGSSKKIEYAPSEGNELASITVDEEEVDTKNYSRSYDFENIKEDHSVFVSYQKIENETNDDTDDKKTDSDENNEDDDKNTDTDENNEADDKDDDKTDDTKEDTISNKDDDSSNKNDSLSNTTNNSKEINEVKNENNNQGEKGTKTNLPNTGDYMQVVIVFMFMTSIILILFICISSTHKKY